MINIIVVDENNQAIKARVYLSTDTEVLVHTKCDINGQIYITEPSITGGRVLVRIRLPHYLPIEFYLDRDSNCDLEFCVRMYLD